MDRIWTTEREGIIRIKVEDEEREDQCVAVLVRTKAEFLFLWFHSEECV
jgi:hypothetical protein